MINMQHVKKHQTILLAIAITANGAPQELFFLLDAQMPLPALEVQLVGWSDDPCKGFQIQMVIS